MSMPARPPHPGRGGAGRILPRGREIDPHALEDMTRLLGARPRERRWLIEYLHLVQDEYRQISAAHLAALAELLRLSFAEVYEVATFYAHFDVVKEEDARIPPVTVRVCDGIACAIAGAESLAAELSQSVGGNARVVHAPCIGQCDCAPAALVQTRVVGHATAARVREALASGDHRARAICRVDYDAYRGDGGYRLFEALRSGAASHEDLLAALDAAGHRGLGGAGFPAGRKWRAVRDMPAPRAMIVNADEGEPGTFKDRFHLESDPHRCLEGALIAAWFIEADVIHFYLRDEYAGLRQSLADEIAKLPADWPRIELRRGAGAYICGEESALIESLEGKRGLPRQRPPLPFQAGLFGRPTLTNNVETLHWVRDIFERGPDWWTAQGRHGRVGLRSFSVSGRVREPGVKLAPAGITLRELVDEYCGGMAEGHVLRAYLPGGASGGLLPARLADAPLDFGTLDHYGCFIGSAAIVVFSQADDLTGVVRNLMHFFADESCGQCTPCRLGTRKALQLMDAGDWDRALLGDLSAVMRDASICGLGQAAPNPVDCLMRYFPEEFSQGAYAESQP
ncbi:MAG: NAD(P)H-dependent oxidoreductase subunit E [Beijerinckiaceae bacterium]|nr:NAD(P)H-dependent oxidoreductase subunit E [Beijerinckiaceae bacterium]